MNIDEIKEKESLEKQKSENRKFFLFAILLICMLGSFGYNWLVPNVEEIAKTYPRIIRIETVDTIICTQHDGWIQFSFILASKQGAPVFNPNYNDVNVFTDLKPNQKTWIKLYQAYSKENLRVGTILEIHKHPQKDVVGASHDTEKTGIKPTIIID